MKKKCAYIATLVASLVFMTGCSGTCDHEWIYTDNGDGTHLGVCSKDCSHKKTEEHHFNDGTITVKPTDSSPGKKEFECKECKYTYTETLPATGEHVFDQEVEEPKYLYKELSTKTKVYYKSSKDGAFGNPDYLFERSPFLSDERLKDYTEVEYIGSNDESYIDTGLKATNKTRIKTKAYAESPHSIFGGSVNSRIGLGIKYLTFGDYNGDGYAEGLFSYYNAEEPSPYSADLAYKIHTFDFNKNEVYVDDKLFHTFQESEFLDPNNLFLLACNSLEQIPHDNGEGIRMYNCQIYEDDVLQRDFIPVYRNSDHKYGMFDFKNYEFYPVISNEKEQSYYKNEYRQDELPEGYKQVLYIENDSKNRIDTGLIFNKGDEVCASGILQVNENNPNAYQRFGANYWVQYKTSSFASVEEPYYSETFAHRGSCLNYNNDINVASYFYSTVEGFENVKMGVFALGDRNNTWWNNDIFASMKLYSYKITQDDKLLRDFIPCLREGDNTPGLFDVVESKFYEAENLGGPEEGLKYEENWKEIKTLGAGRYSPKCGHINSHLIDEGVITKEATAGEKGEITYTCKVCHKEFKEEIDSIAYTARFSHPNNVKVIVQKDLDTSTGIVSDVAYSRNQNSFNYSKVNADIIFKIDSSKIYEIKDLDIKGNYESLIKLGDNYFKLKGLISDVKVTIPS